MAVKADKRIHLLLEAENNAGKVVDLHLTEQQYCCVIEELVSMVVKKGQVETLTGHEEAEEDSSQMRPCTEQLRLKNIGGWALQIME